MERRRVVVRGEVQGVGYRWAARERANELGVAGFVQNRPDGSVLAELRGEAEAVDAMMEWLRHGPPGARVTSVETSEGPTEALAGSAEAGAPFEIRR